ncbi:MAG: response regulator, partial [Porticoccaceae bacterium]|nr:response regulator [Porticoccaceae bacterium]
MNSNAQVWIAEDDRSLRWVMEKAITRDGNKVRSFENGDALLTALGSAQPDIIVSDIRMPGIDGLDLLKELNSRY